MNTSFLALALLGLPLVSPRAEFKPLPIYRQPVPAEFCIPATKIGANVEECSDNMIFLRKAQDCAAKLENLHKRVANELAAQMKLNQTNAQKTSFSSHQADTSEASAAHEYMIKVTEQALADLDPYFDQVTYPEDAENDDDVLNSRCYSDAVMPLDELVDNMETKLAEMKAGRGIESAHSVISGGNKQKVDNTSLNPLIKGGVGQGSGAAPSGQPKNRDSDVTGIKENEQKRAKEKLK